MKLKMEMKVLFIGNSHTYFNDMPQTFADQFEEITGEHVDVTMLAYSYKELKWHAQTEYFAMRFAIMYGNYDYCIVQQQAHPFAGEETTAENSRIIADICCKAGTAPMLVETWAEREHPENQEGLTEGNNKAALDAGAMLAPVGKIWQRIRCEHPEIELFWKDGEHASSYGSYLVALTLCACILHDRGSGASIKCATNMARDFVYDMDIDFDAPRVIENTEKTIVELDEAKAEIIKDTIIAVQTSSLDNVQQNQ